jgi:hypothetical protein
MPTASRRRQLLEAFRARLEAIDGGADFETDAGRRVFVNETPAYGPDDPESAISIAIGDDTPQWQQNKLGQVLPVAVLALARQDLDDPMVTAEKVLADIQRAIELTDRTLGGLVNPELLVGTTVTAELPEGATTVGVQITYIARYERSWGNP